MVVDTIQQQGARRETLLPVDNVEVLERHLPFFVQHNLARSHKNMRWNGWRTRRAGRVLPAARDTGRLPAAAGAERGGRGRLRGAGRAGWHWAGAAVLARAAGRSQAVGRARFTSATGRRV
jgi:hypothetical protein